MSDIVTSNSVVVLSCCYLVLCSLVLFLFMYIYYLCDFFSLFCVSVQNYILG